MGEVENGAIQIADLMAQVMKPASSAEQEILDTVARYSLQITPEQHFVLNRLQVVAVSKPLPELAKRTIEAFIPAYQEMKRYHDTLPFIGRTIEAMSLKRFVETQSIKGNVMVTKQ